MTSEDKFIEKQIGNYRVTKLIASGSFGHVYLGEHVILTTRIVAIKLFYLKPLGSDEERESFMREAQLLEQLKHPRILSIIDAGIDDNVPYLVTEYAPKGSLQDRIIRQEGQAFPLDEAITILSQIGEALEYAHQQRIVHRDLKPHNILFDARGDALLADFGIATVLNIAHTVSYAPIVGTPSYMAPEQFQGAISRASDQYALGCIAYELFTGRRPFVVAPNDAPSNALFLFMYKHTNETPIPPTQLNSQIPRYIEQAILKAMAKNRQDRYTDVSSFIAALQSKCPFCSAEIRPGDNFCLNCGNRLQPSTPSAQAAVPMVESTIPASAEWVPPVPQSAGSDNVWSNPDLLTITADSADTLRSSQATPAVINKIEEPAHLILRADNNEVLHDYVLDKFEMSIGRAPNCDILLSKEKLTSRRHATILYENGQYSIRDERSANGTFVNSQQLDESSVRVLQNGDHIGIGEHELVFQTARSSSSSVDIESMPTMAVSPPMIADLTYNTYGSVALDEPFFTRPSSFPPLSLDTEQVITQLFDEGDAYYKSRKYEEALAIYDRIIQMNARNVGAYGNKGNVLRKRGKFRDAFDAYDTALNIDPNRASILNARGDLFYQRRQYEKALADYDAALALNENDARTWTAKGNTLAKLKQYEKVIIAYDHALTLNPNNAAIWAAKGDALYKLERYQEALAACDNALVITPKKALFWDTKGNVLYKLEHYEEALDAHNRALALDPYNASISSTCDRLRDLIKHIKDKLARPQVNEQSIETRKVEQSETEALSSEDMQTNQLSTRQKKPGLHQGEYFDVFLSHSHLDAQWVERHLAIRLEDGHGFRVWLDKWILVPGEPWQPALARGIDQAHCCVVCIGEEASSGWFQQVIQRAKHRQSMDPLFRVIPVFLPNARDINIDDFLELNTLVDFRKSDFARAFHMLVCGVKGIPPGKPLSDETMTTRTRTLAEEMLLDLQRLRQNDLITDPVKDDYTRITMEKVWFAEWTLKAEDNKHE